MNLKIVLSIFAISFYVLVESVEFLNILVGLVWSVISEDLNGGFLANPLQFSLNWLFHVVRNVNMLNL